MNYTATAAKVRAKIAAAGRPAAVVVPAPGTFDAVTGKETPTGVEAVHATSALEVTYSLGLVGGSLVKEGDRLFMVPALASGLEPVPGHRLRLDGKDLEIANVRTTRPGGVPLYHEVLCRG